MIILDSRLRGNDKIVGFMWLCKGLTVYAYNICRDHVHMLIECEENKVSNMVRQIKGKSSQLYKEYLGKATHDPFHLWAQKFNKWLVKSDEQLRYTVA